ARSHAGDVRDVCEASDPPKPAGPGHPGRTDGPRTEGFIPAWKEASTVAGAPRSAARSCRNSGEATVPSGRVTSPGVPAAARWSGAERVVLAGAVGGVGRLLRFSVGVGSIGHSGALRGS